MALVKPIALSKSAFDSINEETFSFSSSGGDQVVKNRLTIRKNDTNEVVYQKTIETFQFLHKLPKNTLKNGIYYNYYFNTFNVNGNMSPDSNVVPFYCYTTPTIEISNMTFDNVIENSTYEFEATYNQKEGELIDFIRINLYNKNGALIQSSPNLYTLSAPPFTVSHKFNGLVDKAIYFIEAIVNTINGTVVSTDKIEFSVNYIFKEIFSKVDLFPKCNEGYVQVVSNIVIINGLSNPSPPEYVTENNTIYIDVSKKDYWVKFIEGFKVPEYFEISIWFKPSYFGKMCDIWNQNLFNSGFKLNYNRYIPYGETIDKDCIELYGYDNGQLKVFKVSNYIDVLNNVSDAMLWIRKLKNEYQIRLEPLRREQSILEWEGQSNIEEGKVTNIFYKDDLKYINQPVNEISNNIDNIFPLNGLQMINAKYDQVGITEDVEKEFSVLYPEWNYRTKLICNFDKNINGGNVDILISQLSSIKIKRRKYGESKWITLYEVPIKTVDDLFIVKSDTILPEGHFEWALVPVLSGNIEGSYIVADTEIQWNGIFISTADSIFKMYTGTSYQSFTFNQLVGVLQPIGSQYPITIKNSKINYVSGTISGTLLGYNYETAKKIDSLDVIQQVEDLRNILISGKSITIKDWNGNIWIGSVSNAPTITYNSAYGHRICDVSFSFVEQGKYDNQEDLYYSGLVDILE